MSTCLCPDDCNCRSLDRTNYCGCRCRDARAATLAREIEENADGALDRAFFGTFANTGAIHPVIFGAAMRFGRDMDTELAHYVLRAGPRPAVDGWISAPYVREYA